MAVMRVEKNGNYTVMSNYHLRDPRLSLKAKGLLSVMLSLPVEWDFTLAGLACISKEGIDAIRAAVNELVKAGYIIRAKVRNAAGQLVDMEYIKQYLIAVLFNAPATRDSYYGAAVRRDFDWMRR